jgi:flagellum-specific peptidoglycan hydrolase FlgJ
MKDTITIIHNNPKKDIKKQVDLNPNAIVKITKIGRSYPTSIKQLWVSLNHALQWPQLKESLRGPALLATARKNWFGISACALFLLFFFRTPDIQTTKGNIIEKHQEATVIPLDKAGFSADATKEVVAAPPTPVPAKKHSVAAIEEETMVSIPQIPKATRSDRSILKELGNHAQSIRDQYISRFVPIAKTAQEKFGIPASVILGLAILRSEFGTSVVAIEGHNHLHVSCEDNPVPMGKGMVGQGIHGGVCYTRYESTWMGFRAHSELIQRKYKKAVAKAGNNYEKWANALEKADYFHQDDFSASALIKTIELYQLHQFDNK